MRKLKAGVLGVGLGFGAAVSSFAQTNTIAGVTTQLTSGLGTALDVGIGIGVVACGIGLAVGLIKKGVRLRA